MFYTNVTRIKNFFIIGFPGLSPVYYGPVSALLLLVFLAIAVGNIFILVFVKCERSLQKPTYLIFCHLALTDLAFGTVTLPKIISKYWFDNSIISFYGCFTQMFFVHFLGATHSFILMVMALDRFIAICAPLRYHTLFTNTTVSVLCGTSWFMSMSWMMGMVLHALTLSYCNHNVITQCYCDHISITRLGCGENVASVKSVSLGSALFSLLVPLSFIIISYLSIIIAVFKMSHNESRHKVLSTCAPQIFITCLYYVPRCFVYLAYNLGFSFSVDARVVITTLYSLIPAVVNPLIYCFKTRDIKETLIKRFKNKKVNIAIKIGYQ
ncbi:hypothetical protein PAMP_018356 [Pampus punctatissimus]